MKIDMYIKEGHMFYRTTDGQVFEHSDDAIEQQYQLNTNYYAHKFPLDLCKYYIKNRDEFDHMINREWISAWEKKYDDFTYVFPNWFITYLVEGEEYNSKEFYALPLSEFKIVWDAMQKKIFD